MVLAVPSKLNSLLAVLTVQVVQLPRISYAALCFCLPHINRTIRDGAMKYIGLRDFDGAGQSWCSSHCLPTPGAA
eukprot:scaffold125645_cov21-Tisochrysis_lutea.AAC.1